MYKEIAKDQETATGTGENEAHDGDCEVCGRKCCGCGCDGGRFGEWKSGRTSEGLCERGRRESVAVVSGCGLGVGKARVSRNGAGPKAAASSDSILATLEEHDMRFGRVPLQEERA